MAMIHTGKVMPIVFHKRYYGLDDVRKAMADLQAKKVYGKAVIDLNFEKDKGRAAL
jgi:NADPH2:quinone reductase